MAKSINVPPVVDIKKVSDRETLLALASDPAIDRRFEDIGPLANREVVERVNEALRLDGKPLPSVAPRDDTERAKNQKALRKRLDGGKLWDDETLAALIAAVRGKDEDTIGPAAQQAVGRLFNKTYVGDAASFAAARDLDDAVRSLSIRKAIALKLKGRLETSRRLLADRVGGNLAGVHGTGIAVHNMVRGFETMRELLGKRRKRPSTDDAVKACLFAPDTVLRQATAKASTAAGDVKPGTLVMLQLGKISEETRDPETVFMAGTWAECPAMNFVPALYRAVWEGVLTAEAAET